MEDDSVVSLLLNSDFAFGKFDEGHQRKSMLRVDSEFCYKRQEVCIDLEMFWDIAVEEVMRECES